METITRKVVSYCSIPDELTDDHWLSDYPPDCYVNYTIGDDEISEFILENHSELSEFDVIFIQMDY